MDLQLTTKAQEQLFNSVDSFDDEGFVAQKKYVPTPPYYIDTPQIENPQFWIDVYKTEANPGWNLNDAAEAFRRDL